MVTLWGLTMAAAMFGLWRYKATPGTTTAAAPTAWPSDVELVRARGKATIVMLAHPMCPCTKASLSELAVLMARVGQGAKAYVLFLAPRGAGEGWEKSATWEQAAAIPGVQAVSDRGGAIAARFGATVSGHTVLYDADGTLAYSGGITPSRGHSGENAGRWQIVARIENGARGGSTAGPTFGCELFEGDGGGGGQ